MRHQGLITVKNVQEVRQFYDLVNYYHLHSSLVAFERLKKAITTTPVLVQPDSIKSYTIEMNSSDFGNGMILYQEDDDGKLHSVAFDECKLYGAEL